MRLETDGRSDLVVSRSDHVRDRRALGMKGLSLRRVNERWWTAGYTIETHRGKLIEARVEQLLTAADADEYSDALAAAVERGRHRAPVLCADHRPVKIYPQEAADCLAARFQANNSRFERIAIIVSPTNATLLMQLERIAREARFPNRRVFRQSTEALDHLAHGLDATELQRARVFLTT
jgi:hypothetical protein